MNARTHTLKHKLARTHTLVLTHTPTGTHTRMYSQTKAQIHSDQEPPQLLKSAKFKCHNFWTEPVLEPFFLTTSFLDSLLELERAQFFEP